MVELVVRTDSDGRRHTIIRASEQAGCAAACIAMIGSLRAQVPTDAGDIHRAAHTRLSTESNLAGLDDEEIESALGRLGGLVKASVADPLRSRRMKIWPGYIGPGRPAMVILEHWQRDADDTLVATWRHGIVATRMLRDRSKLVFLDPVGSRAQPDGGFLSEHVNNGRYQSWTYWTIATVFYSLQQSKQSSGDQR